ncbi:4-demethylwyosine synthase TYW1 [Candidatus Pacearchaeota archaeon]|nr:4-demethylwyosine synthase TYW1 [Candidatus Pacearchaeota archaeon]
MNKKTAEILKKQHYFIAGKHSVVQICRWTKKSLLNEGECYKSDFYGIKSYGCCEMSPASVFCDNHCLHCWRAIENSEGNRMFLNVDKPKTIIEECIKGRKKLLSGFKGNKKVNIKKWEEAQEPSHFAISLIGEPTLYPCITEMIQELKKRKKITFLVTNGLHPEVLEKMNKKKCLPTQLYLSLNTPNEEMYDEWHKSDVKNAWKVYNKTLKIFPKLKTRKVIRMTLVKGQNSNMKDDMINDYAELIKKANPDFVEVKGFMSIGFSRNRKGMGYDAMPNHEEVEDFSNKLAKAVCLKILDEHKFSRVILLGKYKNKMKIKNDEI